MKQGIIANMNNIPIQKGRWFPTLSTPLSAVIGWTVCRGFIVRRPCTTSNHWMLLWHLEQWVHELLGEALRRGLPPCARRLQRSWSGCMDN